MKLLDRTTISHDYLTVGACTSTLWHKGTKPVDTSIGFFVPHKKASNTAKELRKLKEEERVLALIRSHRDLDDEDIAKKLKIDPFHVAVICNRLIKKRIITAS